MYTGKKRSPWHEQVFIYQSKREHNMRKIRYMKWLKNKNKINPVFCGEIKSNVNICIQSD